MKIDPLLGPNKARIIRKTIPSDMTRSCLTKSIKRHWMGQLIWWHILLYFQPPTTSPCLLKLLEMFTKITFTPLKRSNMTLFWRWIEIWHQISKIDALECLIWYLPVDVTILRVYILKECNAIGANKEIHCHNSISKKSLNLLPLFYGKYFWTDCE